jgi:hypothetical protein
MIACDGGQKHGCISIKDVPKEGDKTLGESKQTWIGIPESGARIGPSGSMW